MSAHFHNVLAEWGSTVNFIFVEIQRENTEIWKWKFALTVGA